MSPKRRLVLAALVIVTVVALFFSVYVGRPEATPEGEAASRTTDTWIDAVHTKGRAGYWLVVRGTHPGDQLVAAASAGSLTHAAMYDAERDEVIEAVGKGVQRTPLRELLAQAHRLQVIEPRGYSAEAAAQAIERARSHVGYRYDWLGTVGLQSDRRFYCTELCVDAYRGRDQGWSLPPILHPEAMERYGELVFDSGNRPSSSPVAAASDELRARFASTIDDARGVDYAALVAPGLYRGGVPDAEGVEWLRSIGVKTVVNLRHYHGDTERALVEGAGMRYEEIPLESTDPPAPEQIATFLRIAADPTAQPVYVHCLHGVDRTGAMIGAYRVASQGWTNSDALAEMEYFGAHDILHDLRHFVASFTPR